MGSITVGRPFTNQPAKPLPRISIGAAAPRKPAHEIAQIDAAQVERSRVPPDSVGTPNPKKIGDMTVEEFAALQAGR